MTTLIRSILLFCLFIRRTIHRISLRRHSGNFPQIDGSQENTEIAERLSQCDRCSKQERAAILYEYVVYRDDQVVIVTLVFVHFFHESHCGDCCSSLRHSADRDRGMEHNMSFVITLEDAYIN
jgi:hypothetical protein